MRILHTSDWHLGRQFGPYSLAEDQRAFTDWMLGLVEDERIDLVVIAGDVFDRAVAPKESIAHFRSVLSGLVTMRTRVAVITGNHDSPDRVAPYSGLLDASGVILRGGYTGIGEVVRLDLSDGPLDLVLLPYLEPQAAPNDLGLVDADRIADDTATNSDYQRRMRRTHESVLRDAVALARPQMTTPRSIAVAHAFVANGEASESERELMIGGTGSVAADVFEPFSYTALGHLHRPQDVPGIAARYSGTPLAYSFSEGHGKSVTIIEMAPDGATARHEVAVPMGRKVRDAKGPIDELLAENAADDDAVFVRAILTDPGVVVDAKSRLAKRWPWIIEIIHEPEGMDSAQSVTTSAISRRAMSHEEIIEEYWRRATFSELTADERELIHAELGEVVREVTS